MYLLLTKSNVQCTFHFPRRVWRVGVFLNYVELFVEARLTFLLSSEKLFVSGV